MAGRRRSSFGGGHCSATVQARICYFAGGHRVPARRGFPRRRGDADGGEASTVPIASTTRRRNVKAILAMVQPTNKRTMFVAITHAARKKSKSATGHFPPSASGKRRTGFYCKRVGFTLLWPRSNLSDYCSKLPTNTRRACSKICGENPKYIQCLPLFVDTKSRSSMLHEIRCGRLHTGSKTGQTLPGSRASDSN